MKISIVTISYNQAAFLEDAILSVLNQEYNNIEYIIVDPGSTDGSREIIEKYRDRIDHVIYEKDDGPADGLNKGFAKASGDIYGFLNSDDIFLSGALESAVKILMNSLDIDVVSGHGFIIDKSNNKVRKIFSDRYSLFRDAYGQSVLVQPSTFFRAPVYKRVDGFNVNNHSNWDGELFYNIAQQGGKFKTINAFWSGYRLYPESITGGALLDAKIKVYDKRKFQEIMGRPRGLFDRPLTMGLNIFKHISNFRAFFERVRKGGVYGKG